MPGITWGGGTGSTEWQSTRRAIETVGVDEFILVRVFDCLAVDRHRADELELKPIEAAGVQAEKRVAAGDAAAVTVVTAVTAEKRGAAGDAAAVTVVTAVTAEKRGAAGR